MRTYLFTSAGVLLLLLVAYDIYATVLDASAHFGPIGERLNRAVWKLARAIAFRIPRRGRHKLLNIVGPLLMPLLIAVFIVATIVAFALIYFPRMPDQFSLPSDTQSSLFFNAVYFSGATLTTAGYGDIVPRTTAMRLIAMFESAFGLALISLAITYLLAVYGALGKKRAVALSLYHEADEGADAAAYIAYHFVEGKIYGLRESLRAAARDLQTLFEAHVEHPVIHYFHPVEVFKGLPRMLFLLLESCVIIRSSIDETEYADLIHYPEVKTLEANSLYMLRGLVSSLDLESSHRNRGTDHVTEAERLMRRYRRNLDRLSESGIRTREGTEGFAEYIARRKEWESKLQRLSEYLGYDWDEITGDLDLEYAADEEKKKPQK